MALYAIGDIQGCGAAFDALLRKLAFRAVARPPLARRGSRQSRARFAARAAPRDGPRPQRHLRARQPRPAPARDRRGPPRAFARRHVRSTCSARRTRSGHRRLAPPQAAACTTTRRAKRVLVHAGIPPDWTVQQARAHAREVETALRGPRWRAALRTMYGNEPIAWSRKLDREERRRYTINALTRMRYCDRRGRLDLSESGPPGSQPKGLKPWFDVETRRSRNVHIVVRSLGGARAHAPDRRHGARQRLRLGRLPHRGKAR